MTKLNYARVLILGKTGVGKSSFINYYLGLDDDDEIAVRTGCGLPVTEEGFHEYLFEKDNPIKIKFIDTDGIEVENSKNRVGEIRKYIVKQNSSNDISEWFHTIFYCVSINNGRFEEFEANFINNLSKEINQKIHIILTNCDTPDNPKADEMIEYIKTKLVDKDIKFYKVCSINKKKRNGSVISKFGREEIAEKIFETLWKDICRKVSDDYAQKAYDKYDYLCNKFLSTIRRFIKDNVSVFKLKELFEDDSLNEKFEEYFSALDEEFSEFRYDLDDEYEKILEPICELYNDYYKFIYNTDADLIIYDELFDSDAMIDLDNMDDRFENTELMRLGSELEEINELTLHNVGLILKLIKKVLFIQDTMLEIIDDTLGHMKDNLSKNKIQEEVYEALLSKIDDF